MEVIIVTGANRGIGLALTRALLANKNVVIAGGRRPDESFAHFIRCLSKASDRGSSMFLPESRGCISGN
jgi:NAD(P)-dependent dehydrogenase (short-subunit alcohol dehydrogenase family)